MLTENVALLVLLAAPIWGFLLGTLVIALLRRHSRRTLLRPPNVINLCEARAHLRKQLL